MPTKYKAIKIDGVKYDYHRWLMEQHLGRKLDSNEVVHHLDGNPRNNDIDNLKVMSNSEHSKLHGKKCGFPDWVAEENSRRLKGSISHRRKLSEEDVIFIREHYKPRDKEYGARALGKRFGIDHGAILDVVNDKSYTKF